jgi:hypothetical protein
MTETFPVAIERAFFGSASPTKTVDHVYAILTNDRVRFDVSVPAEGSLVVDVYVSAWDHVGTVVLTDGWPIDVFDIAPRDHSSISVAELARRTRTDAVRRTF